MHGRAIRDTPQGPLMRRDVATPFFHEEFPSDLGRMADVMRRALEALSERGWVNDEAAFWLRLCLEEALVNAIYHGNKGDPTLKVNLEIAETGAACCIRVQDEGGGFVTGNVPEPSADSPGGRGICLIKHYMDDVEYDAADQCLVMCFRRKAEGAANNES